VWLEVWVGCGCDVGVDVGVSVRGESIMLDDPEHDLCGGCM